MVAVNLLKEEADTTGCWVPGFDFEVLSLGVECRKFLASCYRVLAASAGSSPVMEGELSRMAGEEESAAERLSQWVNNLLEQKLAVFYQNGGMVMEPSVDEMQMKTIRPQAQKYLLELKAHEQETSCKLSDESYGSPLEFARSENRYYQSLLQKFSEIYPDGEVKGAFRYLAEA